jgi:ABC-type sugar transport system ATPase subunit
VDGEGRGDEVQTIELTAEHLFKSYGSTRALVDVSTTLRPGRIHAFAGENGAGKSTLLKILAGVESADGGTLLLNGKPYRPRNLRDAEEHGIALVFQELTINPSLGIAENIYIDRMRRFSRRFGTLDAKKMRRTAQIIIDRLDIGISVEQDIASLDLGQLKCIEICRALSTQPSLILLDEATAFLGWKEVEAVLAVMRRLREEGVTLGFVSHHIAEVMGVADTVIILKDGANVGELHGADINAETIHTRMVGREVSAELYPARHERAASKTLLELSGIRLAESTEDLNLTVHAGEVVGIAGLKGAGGEQIIAIIAGDQRAAAGAMALNGSPYRPRLPTDGWLAGISYVPGDRAREGLIVDFSILDNLVMAASPHRGPVFNKAKAVDIAKGAVRRLSIKTNDIRAPCSSLSGGNMQKVVLGKCLGTEPRLMLLNNPTRGVDVGARQDIYRAIRKLVDGGLAVLLVSEDLTELLGISERLIVLRRGNVSGSFDLNQPCTEQEVVRCMV